MVNKMSEEEIFDAIVIGAGPAGTACAYKLAQKGKSVLLIDRSSNAGGKNLMGGRLYTYALDIVDPELRMEAKFERKVAREQIMVLGKDTGITIDFENFAVKDQALAEQSYTILRAGFDEWFAGKAEEIGVMLATGIKVDDLLIKDDKVIGVIAGDDKMYANTIVAADGINSFMAQKAGLRDDLKPTMVGVGVKEVISLPAKIIQERFQVGENEGAARMVIGGTDGLTGGGFLYTNKESISLGMVFSPEKLNQSKRSIQEIYQDFKMNPAIQKLIGDGESLEYGAHLVPEGGWLHSVPKKLYRNGFLIVGDAAGFCINTGTILRGMDLALLSGVAAANAILSEKEIGLVYMEELQRLNLIQTMKLYKGWPNIIGLERMATVYPQLINEITKFMFTVDGKVPQKMPKAMMHITRKYVTLKNLVQDAWKGGRSI